MSKDVFVTIEKESEVGDGEVKGVKILVKAKDLDNKEAVWALWREALKALRAK